VQSAALAGARRRTDDDLYIAHVNAPIFRTVKNARSLASAPEASTLEF
jgi:hypothetical protein